MEDLKDLIDKSLLGEFLSGLKSLFATKDAATAESAGLMSAADKAKLDGLPDSGGGGDFLSDEDFVAYTTGGA